MAYRILRKQLEKRTEFLGDLLAKNLYLETWAPGDGWTRYRVTDIDTGRYVFGSRYYNLHEMDAALSAVMGVIDYGRLLDNRGAK